MKMPKPYDVRLDAEPLSPDKCRGYVARADAGAIAVFEGTVRNATSGRKVVKLEFEAYEDMAIREMEKIALRALEKFEVHMIAIHHRIGVLGIGETPVVIAVSAAHRKAAFEACAFAIDTLKETVPIWKKEYFNDGETWVAAHP